MNELERVVRNEHESSPPNGHFKDLRFGCKSAILDFISAKFVMGYPCVRHYILFCSHGPAILHFF